MKKIPYLIRRKAFYYYRRVLPLPFYLASEQKEIKISLYTSDIKSAKKLHFIINFTFDAIFESETSINNHGKPPKCLLAKKIVERFKDMTENILEAEKAQKSLIEIAKPAIIANSQSYNALPIDYINSLKKIQCMFEQLLNNNHNNDVMNCENYHKSNNSHLKHKKHLWTDVFDEFCNDPDIIKRNRPNLLAERKSCIKTCFDIMRVKYIEDVDSFKVEELRIGIQKIPSNYKKLFPKKSIKEVLEDETTNDLPKLNVRTIQKYLNSLRVLFRYSVEKAHYIKTNPIGKIPITKTRKEIKREANAKIPFSDDDLDKIFNPDVYMKLRYNNVKLYFIPIIALSEGMRLNEICQLTTNDIYKKNNIWVIDIKEGGNQKTKNASSERIIPVSRILIKLGFLDYIEKIKANNNTQIFKLPLSKRGYYSRTISDWFRRYRLSISITDKTKTFHSLRHSFAKYATKARIPSVIINSICGWVNSEEMLGHYANKFSEKELFDEINKIKFPCLENLIKAQKGETKL